MCLGIELTRLGKQKRIKKYTKNGHVRLYKVLHLGQKAFWPPDATSRSFYKRGINKATGKGYFWYGFHAFFDKSGALSWRYRGDYLKSEVIAEVLVRPSWIMECGLEGDRHKTCTCTKMFFPKFPNTKARVKDFRAALKKLSSKK